MALLINGTVRVDLTDEKNAYTQKVLQMKREMEATYKYPIVFRYNPELVRNDFENPGKKIKPSGRNILLEATLGDVTTGTTTWRYYRSSPLEPRFIEFQGNLTVNNKDFDLAIFLIYMSTQCMNGKNAGKSHKCCFQVENKRMEAESFVQKRKDMSRCNALIFEYDLLGFKEEDLRTFAKAFFVSNIDNMETAEIQAALSNAVEFEEKRSGNEIKGYKRLIEMAFENPKIATYYGLIHDCIENKILKSEPKHWILMNELGQKERNFIPILAEHKKLQDLYLYLSTAKEDVNILKKMLFDKTGKEIYVTEEKQPENKHPENNVTNQRRLEELKAIDLTDLHWTKKKKIEDEIKELENSLAVNINI